MDTASISLSETTQKQPKKRGPKPKAGGPKKAPRVPRWRSLNPPYEVGKDDFNYWDIPIIPIPIDSNIYLPLCYDLVKIYSSKGSAVPGWWTGGSWESHRRIKGKVIGWGVKFTIINTKGGYVFRRY